MRSDVDEVQTQILHTCACMGATQRLTSRAKRLAARFDYDYSEKEIEEVAERSRKLAKEARELHVIFNNNNLDYAPRAALGLRKALAQIVNAPAEPLELF